MSWDFANDDIAIVSMGCLLPQAKNVNEFEQLIYSGRSTIQPMSRERWKKELVYSPYREIQDKTYSHYGAEITKAEYNSYYKKYGLKSSEVTRLEIMSIETLSQAIKDLKLPDRADRMSLVLGVMNPDESFYTTKFLHQQEKLKQHLRDLETDSIKQKRLLEIFDEAVEENFSERTVGISSILATSVINRLGSMYNIKGPSLLVDAACASSLASFDIAISQLKLKQTDLVFCGGLESNLSPGSFVIFSKVGALATERCLPFDQRSEGISQGEGAVIFALQRLEDAIKCKHEIHAVIRDVGASSDGRSASLFQPNIIGQTRAYSRAYKNLGNRRVDYLELHGTGTQIGDFTEAQSVSTFFNEYRIPAGSVKSVFGHTKAAAGGCGVLKCILGMKKGLFPGSEYIQNSVFPEGSGVYVSAAPIKMDPKSLIRCGVSGIGFGGTNFHLVLDNFSLEKSKVILSREPSADRKACVLSMVTKKKSELDTSWFTQKNAFCKIPPKSIRYIDSTQLMAVQAVWEAFENIGLKLTAAQKDEVSVYSASTLGLDILNNLSMRITLDAMAEISKLKMKSAEGSEKENQQNAAIRIDQLKDMYVPLNEDSGPGILNNVIAGRVCNAFNFKGKNLNIDLDQASFSTAAQVITNEIQRGSDHLYVLVGLNEKVNVPEYEVERDEITCWLISSHEFAQSHFVKVLSEIEIQPGVAL